MARILWKFTEQGGTQMCHMAYSVEGAAEATGVSEQAIKEAMKAKELKARRIGGFVVITAADISVWLQSTEAWGEP